MSSNREFVVDFIAKFREHPCLWQVTSKYYHNKQKRESALAELLILYKTKDPGATTDTVKKKIQSLRSSFRKENNKVSIKPN